MRPFEVVRFSVRVFSLIGRNVTRDSNVVRLATADWLKVLGIVVVHTVAVLIAGARLVNHFEHRVTVLETTVQHLVEEVKRK